MSKITKKITILSFLLIFKQLKVCVNKKKGEIKLIRKLINIININNLQYYKLKNNKIKKYIFSLLFSFSVNSLCMQKQIFSC